MENITEKEEKQIIIDEFKDTYNIHPRLMVLLFRFLGMSKNESLRATCLLWDDVDHSSDFELLNKDASLYEHRWNIWRRRIKFLRME